MKEKVKNNLWIRVASISLVLVILFTFFAYRSNQEYKEMACKFPKIDSNGNAIYPEECKNPDLIDTSKNWDALSLRILAIFFGVLGSICFYIGRRKRAISKNGKI